MWDAVLYTVLYSVCFIAQAQYDLELFLDTVVQHGINVAWNYVACLFYSR